jgi:hypothetical protein
MGAFFAGEHGEHSHLADVAIGNRGLGSPGGVLGYSWADASGSRGSPTRRYN